MKKILIIALLLLGFSLFSVPVQAEPTVEVIAPIYEFAPVSEGIHIDHTFKVRNTGDTPLKILNVLPP